LSKTSQPNPAYIFQVGTEEPPLQGLILLRSINIFLVRGIPLNPSPSANFVGIEGNLMIYSICVMFRCHQCPRLILFV